MKIHVLAVVSAAVLWQSPIFAASVAAGAGTRTCGQFAKDYQNNLDAAENLYFSWAQGFMSGKNFAAILEGGTVRDVGAKTLESHKSSLRAYCSKNPLDDFGKAVNVLFESLPVYKGR